MSLLTPGNKLIPTNHTEAFASTRGPLRDGWGLGGICPKHSSIFVAHLVEFEVGRKVNLGQGDSYGTVDPARGVGQDFVLYSFSQEAGKSGQAPIACLVVPYADPQNQISLRLWFRRLIRYCSLPILTDFNVPFPEPRRSTIFPIPPSIPPPSDALTSSDSILGAHSDMVISVAEEVDIGEFGCQVAGGVQVCR